MTSSEAEEDGKKSKLASKKILYIEKHPFFKEIPRYKQILKRKISKAYLDFFSRFADLIVFDGI